MHILVFDLVPLWGDLLEQGLCNSGHSVKVVGHLNVDAVKTSLDGDLPDVVIFRTDSRLISYRDVRAQVKSIWPEARLLMVGEPFNSREIVDVIASGFDGYVPLGCSLSTLIEALDAIRSGGKFIPKYGLSFSLDGELDIFTTREFEVLTKLVSGISNKEIGIEVGISETTVKLHVKNIAKKLGARSRTHIASIVLTRGLLTPERQAQVLHRL